MISEQQLQITTTENKLLYDIRELLKEQNALLKAIIGKPEPKPEPKIEDLPLDELREKVRALPAKPKGWHLMKEKELIKVLRG